MIMRAPLVAVLMALALSACASVKMAGADIDLHDACVVTFGKDGKPKRIVAEESSPQTIRIMNRDIKVRRVFGTRIILRGAPPEPACNASSAPNVG